VAKSLGVLTLDLVAKIGGYIGPLDQAARKTKKTSKDIGESLKTVAASGALLGAGLATGFAVAVKANLNLADAMYKQSQITGIAVEKLSALRFSAGEAGVEFEALSTALVKSNKNIAEAAQTGKGAAADAFADLAIELKNANGELKSTDVIFSEVADRFSKLEDGATKTTFAMDIFGKSGAQLIPLLNSGAEGLRASADEAERLGQIMSTDASRAAEEFNDNLSRLQKMLSGIAIQAGQEAAPALAELTSVFADPEVQNSVASFTSGLVQMGSASIKAFGELSKFVGFIAEEFAAAINGVSGDDIVRLQEQLEDLQKQKNPSFFSFEFAEDTLVVEKKIKEVEARIDAYYKNVEEQAKQTKTNLVAIDVFGMDENPFDVDSWKENAVKVEAAAIEARRRRREEDEKAGEAAKKSAEELEKSFSSTLESLEKEINLRDQLSKVAELSYEIENGTLKGLSADRANKLIALADEVDLLERSNILKESQREADLAAMGERGSLASVQLEYDLKNGIIKLNDKITEQDKERLIINKEFAESQQRVNTIDEMIEGQQRSIDLWGETNDAAKLHYDIVNGILEVEGGIESAQAKTLISNQRRIDAMAQIQSMGELTAKAIERIDEEFAGIWTNLDKGAKGFLQGLGDGFKRTLAEMAHQAITKPITIKLQQAITSFSGGGGNNGGGNNGASGGMSAIGAGGIYAAAALVAVSAIQSWNRKQDEKFAKLTAAYRQGTQSTGTLLGDANKKSESLRNSIDELNKYASDSLNVNYGMLNQLVAIREGITGVASGFARQFDLAGGVGEFNNINTGISSLERDSGFNGVAKGFDDWLGDEYFEQFFGGLMDSINKNLYSKSKKITDTGIKFLGQTLADVLETGMVDALAYAEVRTTKKVLGIKTSVKNKTKTEELDDILLSQLGDVFSGAGEVLGRAADIFGLDFNDFIDDLTIPLQSLSLKGLTGEELTKEIEAFFSSTLDNWAGVLVDGSGVLERFQKVGEGSFETVIRLASELAQFQDVADKLNLNFKEVGFNAVVASQELADFAGGFDNLNNSLASYADKFFSDSEKFQTLQTSLGDAYAKLNVTLPKSRKQFRDLVEGIDLSTEAGRKQFASVIALTNATDSYITALEKEMATKGEATDEALTKEALKDRAADAFDVFSKAIQKDIDKAQIALDASKQLADSLSGALKSMRLESRQNELMQRRMAQAQLTTANAIAKAGGPLPKAGDLDAALSVLTQPSQDLFATFEEYARDFYTTAKTIGELGNSANAKMSVDEKNLAALESALEFYQLELDKLDGIDTSVLSVKESVDKLVTALVNAGSTTAGKGPTIPLLSKVFEENQISASSSTLANTFTQSSGLNAINSAGIEEITKQFVMFKKDVVTSLLKIDQNTLRSANIATRWDGEGLPAERLP
jgi:hypothetical protein